MRKLPQISLFSFILFIIWVLYIANTGQQAMFSWLLVDIPNGDKIGHFTLFSLLTGLAIWASNFRMIYFFGIPCYVATLVVLLFVALEELSQYFIPSRRMDIYDFYADAAGVVVASVLLAIIYKLQQRKQKRNQ